MHTTATQPWTPDARAALIDTLRTRKPRWDVLVIGGGITGAGILRECSRRGLKALLIERQDFAWGTSSKSSKMVHGGLRYLASGQFGLTRDSVRERQRLLQEAPGLVDPLTFLMGHYAGQFPPPFLFNRVLDVYDLMAGQRNHRCFAAADAIFLAPGLLADGLKAVTQFGDAVTDDARLVLRVLHEALGEGAQALNYVEAESVLRAQGRACGVAVHDRESGERFEIPAPVVINATGAWADHLRVTEGREGQIRPLRGSHLVLPRQRFPIACSVSYFHPRDHRPVFVFPWEGTTVIGTTDLDHRQDMRADARITEEEVSYLLEGVQQAFPSWQIRREDVMCTWSGVRPVVGTGALDPSKEKREHSLWDDAGLVTVAGGKLTTFRLIALDVLRVAAPYLDGVTFARGAAPIFARPAAAISPSTGLSREQVRRLQGRYGAAAAAVPSDERRGQGGLPGIPATTRLADTDVLMGEIDWALRHESVLHLDDLLLRRTRLGLLLPEGGESLLAELSERCRRALGWSPATVLAEIERYRRIYRRDFSLPDRLTDQPVPASGASPAERVPA